MATEPKQPVQEHIDAAAAVIKEAPNMQLASAADDLDDIVGRLNDGVTWKQKKSPAL